MAIRATINNAEDIDLSPDFWVSLSIFTRWNSVSARNRYEYDTANTGHNKASPWSWGPRRSRAEVIAKRDSRINRRDRVSDVTMTRWLWVIPGDVPCVSAMRQWWAAKSSWGCSGERERQLIPRFDSLLQYVQTWHLIKPIPTESWF